MPSDCPYCGKPHFNFGDDEEGAYFCKGWENARGCRIEHDAAVAYGLEVLYED